MPDGCLVVYKPSGCTSHDMVVKVRKACAVKAGHAGTLDPMAQGVLLVFIDKALKLLQYIPSDFLDKTYLAGITLGSSTDTYDATGSIVEKFAGPMDYNTQTILEVLKDFTGHYHQLPPAFSAVKVAGKRAYSLARAGEAPDLPSREVHVTSIRLVRDYFQDDVRRLLLRIHCSRGTYIRTIAHEIGRSLSCGAHLHYLLRERVGKWSHQSAVSPLKIQKGFQIDGLESFTPIGNLLPYPGVTLKDASVKKIRNGVAVDFSDVKSFQSIDGRNDPDDPIQIFDPEGRLLALCRRAEPGGRADQKLVPMRVLGEA